MRVVPLNQCYGILMFFFGHYFRRSGNWLGSFIMWGIIAFIAYYIYQHWSSNTIPQYPFQTSDWPTLVSHYSLFNYVEWTTVFKIIIQICMYLSLCCYCWGALVQVQGTQLAWETSLLFTKRDRVEISGLLHPNDRTILL